MTPYATLGGGRQPPITLYQGEVLEVLGGMAAASVQCCVTSPPYWGLRSYLDATHPDKAHELGSESRLDCLGWATGAACGGCYICKMVAVFAGVKRVLRDDGTCWVNIGDGYASGQVGNGQSATSTLTRHGANGRSPYLDAVGRGARRVVSNLPSKNLCLVPARLALALQAAGWYVRSEILWHKLNPLPESVTDRPTKAHEMVYMLTKSPRYFYDGEAVREPGSLKTRPRLAAGAVPHTNGRKHLDNREYSTASAWAQEAVEGRAMRSVLSLASEAFPGAHYATFPQKLITPFILAGSPERCCAACGAGWRRVVEGEPYRPEVVPVGVRKVDASRGDKTRKLNGKSTAWCEASASRHTTGFQPGCACDAGTTAATVLDPFVGSGTTCLVAQQHGRASIGIDLSASYLALAVQRLTPALAQLPLFA